MENGRELDLGLLARVHELYRQALVESSQALQWLADHGVKDATLIERFALGYSPGTLKKILPRQGGVERSLRSLGIITGPGRGYEHLDSCFLIPMFDTLGRVIELVGYPLESGKLRRAGATGGIFNWQAMKNHAAVLLTDDPLQALLKIAHGEEAVIAVVGDEWTSLSDATLREIAPHRIRVDQPKRKKGVAQRLKELGIGQDDPVASESEGPIENGFAVSFSRRRYIVQAVHQDNPRHLRALVRAVAPTPGRFHLDAMDLYSSRDRAAFVREASLLFGEDATLVESDLVKLIAMAEEHLKRNAGATSVEVSEETRAEAIKMLQDPTLIDRIQEDMAQLGIVGERSNLLAGYLVSVSRKMEDPLSMLVLSRSAAGKSALSETLAALTPPEDVIRLTRLTGQALFYQKNQSLRHKLLVVEEESGVSQAASYPLRILLSAKKLAVVTAQGSHEVEGPVAVIVTTTNTDLGDETKSRFLVVSADESQRQTRAIQEAQRRKEAGQVPCRDPILRRHHALQRCLQPFKVVNPYAPHLSFPDHSLVTRREHPKYLALIRAVAFLRQYQRKEKEGVIQVELDDIEVAHRLADTIMGQSLDDLSPPARRLLEIIFQWRRKGMFTRGELRGLTRWGSTQLWGYLKELTEQEWVIDRGGKPRQYELLWDGREGKVILGLRSVSEIRASFGPDSGVIRPSFGKAKS